MPNIIVNHIPDQNLSRRAIGSIQSAVVIVVSVIGSRRDEPASTSAVNPFIPFSRF
jgi:hypothetical protein